MKGRKSWISVKIGMIDPKHQRAIGPAIWLFLHILDNADWETGTVKGYTDKQAHDELGIPKDTIIKHRRKLQAGGYISCKKNDYDQTITIHNWTDPRKYSGKVLNPPNVGSDHERSVSQSDRERSGGSDQQSDQQTDQQSDQQSDHERSVSLMERSSNTKDQLSKANEEKTSSAPSEREPVMTQDEHDLWAAGITPERWSEQIDVSTYPADVQDMLRAFCKVFGLTPPAKVTKKDPTVGYWIKGLRRLKEVCGEYGPDLIELTYLDKSLDGRFNIGNPNSAVEFVASKGGELRRHDILPIRLPGMLEQVRKGAAEIEDFWDQPSVEVEA